MAFKTKDQLAAEHPDEHWRQRLVRLVFLSDFLNQCYIDVDYRIPDELNAAVAPSEVGQRIVTNAVRRPAFVEAKRHNSNVGAKEARLHTLLELYHEDLLIDVEKSEIEALERAINAEIRAKKIRFPFIFGRTLYDRAADLFEEEKERLTTSETQELLAETNQGVFQLGGYLIGPFGLIESAGERYLPPARAIPLFHCSDPSCSTVHSCYLSTSWDAPVNELHTELDDSSSGSPKKSPSGRTSSRT